MPGGLTADGGGIYISPSGFVTVDQSLIERNDAVEGGGIRNAGDRFELINSTISDNKVVGSGGGIWNLGVAHIAFSTITANEANIVSRVVDTGHAPKVGGGIYNAASISASRSMRSHGQRPWVFKLIGILV